MPDELMAGIRIIELGEFISAPFCAKHMANLGAEVIKVEKPGCGDRSRRHGPFPNDEPHLEKSGLFLTLNTDKLGITLDVSQPRGREILKELLRDADFLVENGRPSHMRELGLDYASLKDEFPRLIMVSITAFGQTGPYRDYRGNDLLASALSGYLINAGSAGREPLGNPMSFGDYVAGQAGATAASIALFGRDRTGRGCQCDIAQFQVEMSYYMMGGLETWRMNHMAGMRVGNHITSFVYPAVILPCKDGYYTIYTFIFEHWKRFMEILGNPEWWTKDERFRIKPEEEPMGVYKLAPYMDELDARLVGELEKWTKADLSEKCYEARIPFHPAQTIAEMLENEQVRFRNEVIEMEHPLAGKLKYPGAPAKSEKTPWRSKRPAPLLGQHNQDIYAQRLGYTKQDLVELRRAGVI